MRGVGTLLAAVSRSPALIPGPLAGAIFQYPLRLETAGRFYPGNQVGGQGKGAFFGKIQATQESQPPT